MRYLLRAAITFYRKSGDQFADTQKITNHAGPAPGLDRLATEGTKVGALFAYDQSGEAVGMVGGLRDKSAPDTVRLVAMWVAPVVAWARAIPVKWVITAVTAGNERALRLYDANRYFTQLK